MIVDFLLLLRLIRELWMKYSGAICRPVVESTHVKPLVTDVKRNTLIFGRSTMLLTEENAFQKRPVKMLMCKYDVQKVLYRLLFHWKLFHRFKKEKKDVNIGLADFCSGKRTVDSVLGSF